MNDKANTVDETIPLDRPFTPAFEVRAEQPNKTAPDVEAIDAGRYRPLRFHAAGGLGRIFVAEDTELNREVALKLIKDESLASSDNRHRFELEAEITGRLEHPGVVPVYGFGLGREGRPYYAMRFIRGEPLADAIDRFHSGREKREPGEQVLELQKLLRSFLVVCETAAFAHSRGVIHRDLKPANVMLGRYGETLVVDWGLAKPVVTQDEGVQADDEPIRPPAADELNQSRQGTTKGTPAYMSPEQALGKWNVVGPASDIYSLGAILYTLLTGRLPFEASTVMETIELVSAGQFPPPRQVAADVPPALEAICLKAMHLEPSRRYQTALELAADIEHWLADEPVSAWHEPMMVRLRRWAKRHRTLLTGAAATIVVATVATSLAAWLLREKNQQLQAANERSEFNFEQAHRAVHELLDQASGNPFLRKPGMHKAQESLLRTALKYYRDFVTARSDDPQLQEELADAHLAIAAIVHDIGSPQEALAEYQEARDVLKRLLSQQPGAVPLRSRLAKVDSRLAQLDNELGKVDANRANFAQAVSTYRELLDQQPADRSLHLEFAHACYLQGEDNNDPALLKQACQEIEATRVGEAPLSGPAKVLMARTCNQLALVESNGGRIEEASTSLQDAIHLLSQLVPATDGEPEIELLRGAIDLNGGRLAQKRDDLHAARLAFESARSRFEALSARAPDVSEYKLRLATARLELGKLLLLSHEGEEAKRELAAARSGLEKLVAAFTRVLDRFELARSCLDLGGALLQAGDVDKARQPIEQSFRSFQELIAIDPLKADYRRNLAAAWNQMASIEQRSGNTDACLNALDKARHELEAIVAAHPNRPEFRHALAKVYLNLGLAEESQDRWKNAWPWLELARQAYDDEVREHPEVREYAQDRDDFLSRQITLCVAHVQELGDSLEDDVERRTLLVAALDALGDLKRRSKLSAELEAIMPALQQELEALDKP